MKFLFADANDTVDPSYDFRAERRVRDAVGCYSRPQYPHEVLGSEPYDGILVSYATFRHKYRRSKWRQLQEVGAHRFFRLSASCQVMGDCGAFSYVNDAIPRFSVDEISAWYESSSFSHGISVDHIIKRCDFENGEPREDEAFRYNVTLDNAERFIRVSRGFEPVGAVQGWSPKSMAQAADALEAMGYKYLAVGGLAGMDGNAIERVVKVIREKINPSTKLHLLGVGNPSVMVRMQKLGVSSIDSTSPMIKAFKDESENYFVEDDGGGIRYLKAIRIPEALGSTRLAEKHRTGSVDLMKMLDLERVALKGLRQFQDGELSAQGAADEIYKYQREIGWACQREEIVRTLEAEPWKKCPCRACKEAGLDVVVFRGQNRDKRRGSHNLFVMGRHMAALAQED